MGSPFVAIIARLKCLFTSYKSTELKPFLNRYIQLFFRSNRNDVLVSWICRASAKFGHDFSLCSKLITLRQECQHNLAFQQAQVLAQTIARTFQKG